MDTFKSIIDRISEGLNFFDFSFFVSGFVTYVALLYFFTEFFEKTIDYASLSGILASIVLSYVCGIVSFTMGKWIRSWIRLKLENMSCELLKNKSFDELFQECIDWLMSNKQHDNSAAVNDLQGLFALQERKSIAYSAMWIEIRKMDEKGIYYKPLYRQWVMQAVCEGLAFSWLLIDVLSIIAFFLSHYNTLYVFAFLASMFSFMACCHEARRYAENQIKEVIISYYFLKKIRE